MAYLGLKAKSFIREALVKDPTARMDDLFTQATDLGVTASASGVFGAEFDRIFEQLKTDGAFNPKDRDPKRNGAGPPSADPRAPEEEAPEEEAMAEAGVAPREANTGSYQDEQPTQISVAGPGGSFEALYYEDRVELRATVPMEVGEDVVRNLLASMHPGGKLEWLGVKG